MIRAFPRAALALILGAGCAAAADLPRPEHPTPDAVRPHWANLNGPWDFRFDPRDEGERAGWQKPGAQGFDRRIVVPFPWESELSGVHEPDVHGVAWYRRSFTVPADFPGDHHVWLRFGAVDWRADVWVNGTKVAHHDGGYTPFEADVTDAIKTAQGKPSVLVVRVFDPTDPDQPTGKQVGWYTTTSGIWQTVWLEARPKAHIGTVSIATRIDQAQALITAEVRGSFDTGTYELIARSNDPDVVPSTLSFLTNPDVRSVTQTLQVFVRNPRLWSPESPHLYDVTLEVKQGGRVVDSLKTYFGLRTIARGKSGAAPYEQILLNGKPVYLRLALDQSFNPKGIYTAPSDDFLKRDLSLAKEMGLNGLRIHIKPDEPRRLYWADKLGLLILEDMPNTWRQNAEARQGWEATMREAVVRDRNHPSIIGWVAFNETWGLVTGDSARYKRDTDTQDWVGRMVGAIRKLDPTRLVEDNSPCNYDHVEDTDLNSWHFYIDDHAEAARHVAEVVSRTEPGSGFNYCPGRKQGTAPLINSEYGGVSAGGGDRDVSWSFRDLTTLLRRQPKVQGYVYTELSDIEWEHNGFVNYDRTPKTFGYDAFVPGMRVSDLNGADFIGYGGPPCLVVRPGAKVTVPVFISHYSERTGTPRVRWGVAGWNDEGNHQTVVEPADRPARWAADSVTEQEPVTFTAPGRPFVGAVSLVLGDGDGSSRLAANFVNLVVNPERPLPRAERRRDHEAVLRFAPDDFARRRWSGGFATPAGKAYGRGTGFFEYRVRLPRVVAAAKPDRLTLRFELASKAGREKVDWPQRVNAQDYPQTDARTWPSTVEVALNGDRVARESLPDDPADARGVLSHLKGFDHGSYGTLVRTDVNVSEALAASLASGAPLVVRLAVPDDAAHAGGLCVFGSETGRYPVDPTIEVHTVASLPADLGVDPAAPVVEGRLADRRTVALASGESDEPASWSYTTRDPGPGWADPGFDASGWARGRAGFGTPETPAVRVQTRWDTPRIWLRTTVDLPALRSDDSVTLRLFHDEDAEVFVNGARLLRRRGYVTAYGDVELDASQRALFRPGRNTLAVSCRQTGGGQGLDVGLTLLRGE